MLKTYVRLPNSYEQIAINAGHQMGIPSFSHYFWPALAFGQDGTSHWATQRLGYQMAISNNCVAYDDTIQLYAQSGMAITNTPFFGVQYLKNVNGKPILTDPRLKALLSPWQYALAEQEYAAPPLSAASLQSIRGWSHADAKILAAGGTVLGGTDNPIGIGNFGTGRRGERDGSHRPEQLPDAAGVHGRAGEGDGRPEPDRHDPAGDDRRHGHHPRQPAAEHRDDRQR